MNQTRKFVELSQQKGPRVQGFHQTKLKKGLKARMGKDTTRLLQKISRIHTK